MLKLFVCLLLVGGSLSATPTKIVQLDEDNWQKILQGEWMIEFFAPWCPACRSLHASWSEFADWTDDLGLEGVAQVDVTASPGLSGRFMVTALPTIFHVKDGEFRQYRGARDKDSFISFVEEKKYMEMETIPGWKNPNSVQMTMVSYFFKMSMLLRNVHQMVTEDYGYPYWVSYVIFAVGTIVFGALLGLILVCCVDCFFPYSKQPPTSVRVTQKDDKDSGEDAEDEDDNSESAEEETTVRKRRAKKAD